MRHNTDFGPKLVALLAGVLTTLGVPELHAVTTLHYWTGNSPNSGNWTDNQNWLGGAPVGGDQRLIFQDSAARKINTNNLPANTTFESIWIVDNGYNIYGNTVRIDDLRARYPGGTSSTFRPDIIASADLQIIVYTNNSDLIISGDITLTSDDISISSLGLGDVTLSGAITGTGNLYKTSTGEAILSGTSANTFDGVTSVTGGTLRLNKSFFGFGVTSIPGNLSIGTGTNGVASDLVVLDFNNQIANDATVTIWGTGQLDLNDNSETLGPVTMVDGDIVTGTGLLTLSSNVVASATPFSSIIAGHVSLGSGTSRVFNVLPPALLIVSAVVSGSASIDLAKAGSGELRLSGTNTYLGATLINGGTLTVLNDFALGSTNEGTFLNFGTLTVLSSDVGKEKLTIEPQLSNFFEGDGTSSWAGEIVLNGVVNFTVGAGDFLQLSGPISGVGGFRKTGAGTIRLSGTSHNTFGSSAAVNEGILELQKTGGGIVAVPSSLTVGDGLGGADADVVRLLAGNEVGNEASVSVGSSGHLDLNGFSDTMGGLTGSGHVTLGVGVLTVSNNVLSNTFSGVISDTGGLKKQGAARLTLSGTNTYTGITTINDGQLRINGSLAASPITLAGGMLAGTGTVSTVTSSGPFPKTVGPGASPGILHGSNLLFDAATTFEPELAGTTLGSQYDQFQVNGTVDLGGCILDPLLGFGPMFNDTFTIISNDGVDPVAGTFAGLPDQAMFAIGGLPFQIDYAGGDGNDVVLTRVVSSAVLSNAQVAEGTFELEGLGVAGINYGIEASTNLVDWTMISTNTADGAGIFQVMDTDWGLYQQRFYRAVSP